MSHDSTPVGFESFSTSFNCTHSQFADLLWQLPGMDAPRNSIETFLSGLQEKKDAGRSRELGNALVNEFPGSDERSIVVHRYTATSVAFITVERLLCCVTAEKPGQVHVSINAINNDDARAALLAIASLDDAVTIDVGGGAKHAVRDLVA